MKERNLKTGGANRQTGGEGYPKITITLITAALVLFGQARRASAATLTAGTCQSGGYASIQAAVNAASSGDTVQVCPGTWRENVEISSKNITLQGLGNGATRPTLQYPAELEQICSDSLNCPQILVNGSASTTIKNLIVDGTGFRAQACTTPLGILYVDSGGTVTNNQIVNHTFQVTCPDETDDLANFRGDGVDVTYTSGVSEPGSNFTVTITDNTISSFETHGILADGLLRSPGESVDQSLDAGPQEVNLTGSIQSNSVSNPAGAGFFEVQAIQANLTNSFNIASNNVTTALPSFRGIEVDYSQHPTITSNKIDSFDISILVLNGLYATVSFNSVTNATLLGGFSPGTVEFACTSESSIDLNNIEGLQPNSPPSGIALIGDCGTLYPTPGPDHNVILLNVINDFCAGILTGPPGDTDNNIVANVFENIGPGADLMAGDSCP